MRKYLLIMSIMVGAGTAAADPLDQICPMQVFQETFSFGSNEGNWGFDCATDLIEDRGGNPGAFLHIRNLETFAPLPRTCGGEPSVFTGDYRKAGVSALSVDFKTFSVSFTTEERPMTVVLINHAGTPSDPSDDLYVFYVSDDNIPAPAARRGWRHYQFEIPSDLTTLPYPRSTGEGRPGWAAAVAEMFVPAEDPDAVWNTVIQDVNQVIFWWHDPRFFAIFQSWDVGMDNPAIAMCGD
jgi:hypothetical protein